MIRNKSKLYKKIVINYTLFVAIVIIIINFMFFDKLKEQNINNMLNINFNMIKDIEKEFNFMDNSNKSFINDLYINNMYINDLIILLNNDYNEYLKIKLDIFSASNLSYYKGVKYLIERTMEKNNTLDAVEFISFNTKTSYSFENDGKVVIKNVSLDKFRNLYDITYVTFIEDKVFYISKIKNPTNLKTEGIFILKFNLKNIDQILDNYRSENEVYILDNFNKVVYTSNENIKNNIYENFNQLQDDLLAEIFQTDNNINFIKLNSGFTILGGVNKKSIYKSNYISLFYFLFFSLLIFLIYEIIIFKKFGRLNERINVILKTIENIGNGNKNEKLRIPDSVRKESDEISIIATKFNAMCDRLEESIEKRYIAEINQKNAEMNALQSSINPHFLYNTLEAIRMKAVINKDKEVGKMIFLLSYLYRSQLKEKGIITIKSEIEYCEKFLKIHKFRYDEQFSYYIKCEEFLLNKETIKFILQPLIENYFVHGIRLQNNDNEVSISIIKDNENIKMIIKDNGKGIPKEKLNKILKNIKNDENNTENFGIYNVHKRIINKYGYKYGVSIESEVEKGTLITVTLPYE